ncbi:MAG TPA: InlB B-repeat-containing protein, partial [Acidimicrobiales bacterium]
GYVFTGWNSAANGAGTAYANGASYAFNAPITLFAQWRAQVVNSVTFNANGGKGVVAPQSSPQPTNLTPNGFTRAGFVFTGWNSAANGAGTAYANGASYAFNAPITLFAQWRAVKKPVKPAVHAVVTLNSFNVNSYALTTPLQAQVASLAKLIKANRDTQVALVGYGDTLSKADQLNELKWAAELKLSKQRAIAVEAYLTQQLHSLGVNGFSISVVGQGATNPASTGAADAKNRRVVATIT